MYTKVNMLYDRIDFYTKVLQSTIYRAQEEKMANASDNKW